MSDLIERYGYERAVRELKAMDDRAIWMISSCLKYREEVRKECLEHRRANNIFEVGERVVYINGETDGWVNKLSLFTVVSVIGGVLRIKDIDPDFCYLDIFDYNHIFRHATDEEIQAGRRL